MSRFKKLVVSFLLAIPMVASATGMGLYVPLTLTQTENLDYDYNANSNDFEYQPGAGIGIALDSNIGIDKLYNYRLGFEYAKADVDQVNGNTLNKTMTKTTFNIVNTFGFGVLRTEHVRLWMGPRLNIQFEDAQYTYGTLQNKQSSVGVGLGAALGVNVNFGRVISLAADIDYHVVELSGSEDITDSTNIYYDYNSYSGTNKGVTARFYVLFRFGEQFRKPVEQSIIDYSL